MEITTIQLNNTAWQTCQSYIGDSLDKSYTLRFGEPWVNWGPRNSAPNYYMKLYNTSPTFHSLTYLKKMLIAGGGFVVDPSNIEANNWLEDYNINAELDKVAEDKAIFNGFALDVQYDSNGIPANVEYITMPSLRPENSIKPTKIYVSRDWTCRNLPGNEYFTIPIFEKNVSVSSNEREVYYDIGNFPGNYHLPMPTWISGVKYIELEKELSTFHLAGVTNGLVSSGYFTINDNPTKEEKEKFEQNIKNTFTGVENAARYMVFYDADGKNLTFTAIKSDNNADIYNALNDICVQKVCQASMLSSPTLAGLPGDGSIFTNGLSTAYEYFNGGIIQDLRKPILFAFGTIMKRMGLIKSLKELKIKDLKPIQFTFDSNVLLAVLTKDELRAHMGYSALPNGEGASAGNSPVQTQLPNMSPLRIAPAINPKNTVTTPSASNIRF